ncbi:MAG: hypothetical protein GY850_41775 [bacterium]|nr:hypothetical protein [bacterium]
MKLVNKNAKANLILSRFAFCVMLVLLYSCGGGGGGGDDSSGTGNVSFSLDMQETGTTRAIALRAANNSGSQFECQTAEYLIATIEAQVFDENDVLLAEGGPWDCEDRQGTIGAVQAGDGRIVKVFAKDESGKTIFFGKSGPFTVKEDQRTDVGKIYLEPVNRSPVLDPIGNQEVNEGELHEINISATDDDGDQLLFEIGNKLADANFTFEDFGDGTATAKFSWTPAFDSASNYKVIFKVTDNGVPSFSASEEIAISVGNVPLPPVLSPIGNWEIPEGELLEFGMSATDPDSLNLRFEMGNKPADAEFTFVNGVDGTGTATFSWTPNFDDAGNYPVIFKVFDDTPASEGGPLGDYEEITIAVGNVCRTPVLDPIVPPAGKKEGELIEFSVTAKDPDLPDDALAFSCVSEDIPSCEDYFNPPLFSWTPGFEDAGINTVRFTVSDSCPEGPLSDFKDVDLSVGDTCRRPVLEPIGAQPVIEGAELSFTIAATDPDLPNDTLSYSCESDSEVIDCENSFDPETRIFSWTPGFEDAGSYPVRFIVTDACENPGPLQNFEDVIISVEDTCRPPVLEPIGDKSGNEGDELSFTIAATDPDLPNDALSYSCESDSEVIDCENSIDPLTGFFSWTPGFEDAGSYPVRFIVTDACENPGPLQNFEDVTITVVDVCPDLVVDPIDKPIRVDCDDSDSEFCSSSEIRAVIRNIGNQAAGPSTARVIDLQKSEGPRSDTASTGVLEPGASETVTFFLPYWVYWEDCDVTLEVTADYKNEVSECNEANNSRRFEDEGSCE